MINCDVLVIGGGSAGLAAAVAAARTGADVVLTERGAFLGGAGTASLVHSFCGLYHLASDGEPPAPANPGFPTEIAERMEAATGIGPQRMGRVWILPKDPSAFIRIADEITTSEPTLQVLCHAEALAATHDDGRWQVEFTTRDKRNTLRARALVDASGDAALATMLGRKTETTTSVPLQRPAWIVGITNLESALADEDRLHLSQHIVYAVRSGQVGREALGASFRNGVRPGEAFLTIDLMAGGDDYDPCDPECLSVVEETGRKTADKIIEILGHEIPAWRMARISQRPVRAGVRESRRWHGRHVLTAAEWLAGKRFEDEAALATWPMEFRRDNRGPKLRFPDHDQPCGIPLRSLQAAELDDLWCAGRCISVDHDVQASVRVMGTCFATGEAAGRAAAQNL